MNSVLAKNSPHSQNPMPCFSNSSDVPHETKGTDKALVPNQSPGFQQVHGSLSLFPNLESLRFEEMLPFKSCQRSCPVMDGSCQSILNFPFDILVEFVGDKAKLVNPVTSTRLEQPIRFPHDPRFLLRRLHREHGFSIDNGR